jgi:hypothetical protein
MSLVAIERGMVHNCYIIAQKISYINFVKLCMEEDLVSMNMVADEIGVSTFSLSRWINNLPIYRHIAETDEMRFSISAGCHGQLEDIGSDLFAYIEALLHFLVVNYFGIAPLFYLSYLR